MSDKDNRTNSADFEAHGPTGASRPFGSSELPGAPKAGDAAGVSDAPSATAPLPTAEAAPVDATADYADSAEAVDSSAAAGGEKKKAKRRRPTRALAAAGVAGIVVGGATMAGVNALTNDSSHGNSSWNSGAGKAGNGKPQPPSGNMPQPPDGGGGPQPPSDGQGGNQHDSGNQGSSGKKSSKWGKNATKNKQNQQQKGSDGQQDSSQTQGTDGQSSGGTDSSGDGQLRWDGQLGRTNADRLTGGMPGGYAGSWAKGAASDIACGALSRPFKLSVRGKDDNHHQAALRRLWRL